MNHLVVIILIAVCLHFYSTEFVWIKGTKSCKDTKIYDIIHENTDNMSYYNYKKNWLLFIFIMP
jgi:hypothetical protein